MLIWGCPGWSDISKRTPRYPWNITQHPQTPKREEFLSKVLFQGYVAKFLEYCLKIDFWIGDQVMIKKWDRNGRFTWNALCWSNKTMDKPINGDVFCTEICWIFTTMFAHQYHEISALLGTKNSAKKTFRQWMYSHFINNSTTWRVKKYVPNLRGVVFPCFSTPFIFLQSLHVEGYFPYPPETVHLWYPTPFHSTSRIPPKKNKCRCFPSLIWFLATFCSPLGLVAGEFQWIPAMLMLKHFFEAQISSTMSKKQPGRVSLWQPVAWKLHSKPPLRPKKLMKLDYIQ